jgi:hypothetical protein
MAIAYSALKAVAKSGMARRWSNGPAQRGQDFSEKELATTAKYTTPRDSGVGGTVLFGEQSDAFGRFNKRAGKARYAQKSRAFRGPGVPPGRFG